MAGTPPPPDPDDPLAQARGLGIDGLLALLEQLDGEAESAIATMREAEPGLDADALAAQLEAVAPAFTAGAPAFGALRPSTLREWARWDEEFGILNGPLDVERAFDTTLVERTSNP
jgi:hypothetical protein